MDILNDINLNKNKIFIDNDHSISLKKASDYDYIRIGSNLLVDTQYEEVESGIYIGGSELFVNGNIVVDHLVYSNTNDNAKRIVICPDCLYITDKNGSYFSEFALKKFVTDNLYSFADSVRSEYFQYAPLENTTQTLSGQDIVFLHAPTFNEGFKLGTDDITFNAEETITFATKEEYHNADVAQFSNRITIETPVRLDIRKLAVGCSTESTDYLNQVAVNYDLQDLYNFIHSEITAEVSELMGMSESYYIPKPVENSGIMAIKSFLLKNNFENNIDCCITVFDSEVINEAYYNSQTSKILDNLNQVSYKYQDCVTINGERTNSDSILFGLPSFAVYNELINPEKIGTGIYDANSYNTSGLIAIQENQLFEKVFTNPELTPNESGKIDWTEYVYAVAFRDSNENIITTEYAYKFTPQMQLAEITTDENGNKISVIKETFKQFNMSSSQALVSFETNETIPAGKYELSIIGR